MGKRYFKIRNSHLVISILVVVPMSLIYGMHPKVFWTDLIGLEISNNDLLNIFKAIMGLYLGFSFLWILGLFRARFWLAATYSNIVFMAGLGLGRFISVLTDGISSTFYLIGGFLEILLAGLGIFLLNKFKQS